MMSMLQFALLSHRFTLPHSAAPTASADAEAETGDSQLDPLYAAQHEHNQNSLVHA